MKKALIAIFLISAFAQLALSQIQTAKVTGGEVQGVVTEGISVFKGIPFSALPELLERVLTTYQAKRKAGETFAEFARRHEVKDLQEMFSE